jgi:hypothetical protein
MLACNWRLFQEPPWLEHEAYWCPAPFLLLLVSGTHNLRLYCCWKKKSIFFSCLHNFPFKVANDGTLVLFSTTNYYFLLQMWEDWLMDSKILMFLGATFCFV